MSEVEHINKLAAVVAACLLGACGAAPSSDVAPVRGLVTHNGEPLKGGKVVFMPTSVGRASRGEIQSDGTYRLTVNTPMDGAMIGRHEVEVHDPEFATPLKWDEDQARRKSLAKSRVVEVNQGENVIDLSY